MKDPTLLHKKERARVRFVTLDGCTRDDILEEPDRVIHVIMTAPTGVANIDGQQMYRETGVRTYHFMKPGMDENGSFGIYHEVAEKTEETPLGPRNEG